MEQSNQFGLTFEKITVDQLEIAQEMFRSNSDYCMLEYDGRIPSLEELTKEFCGDTASFFIKADETYIGIIDYLERNTSDGYPWLGFLMIHGDYQGYGYGSNAYFCFEEHMKQLGESTLCLGVIKENTRGKSFWESLGFSFYDEKMSNKNVVVYCYKKDI